MGALAAALTAFGAACAAGDPIETTGGSGSGGFGGAGGAGGALMLVCKPGAEEACYGGPAGTTGIGICAAGVTTCAADGSSFGACVGEVLPMPADDCKTAADEDCDGAAAVCPGGAVWGSAIGDAGDQRALGIAVDGDGNTLVTGSFAGSMTIGAETLTSAGGLDIFVLKLDPKGALIWAESFGGALDQIGNAIAADSAGNVVVAGDLKGSMMFGGQTVASAGLDDALVVKLDASGKPLWAKAFGDAASQSAKSVEVDKADNIVLFSSVEGTTSFGGPGLTSAGAQDVVLAKLNQGGNHLYSKIFGGAGADAIGGVALDSAGYTIITGSFSSSVNFGGAPLTSAGGSDVFVARFSEAGIHFWSKAFGDAADQFARGVAADSAGSVVLTGSFFGTLDLGGPALTSAGGEDIFVAKLDASGAHQWSKAFGDASAQSARAVMVDKTGGVLVAGSLVGTADFGGGALTSAGLGDALVVKLDGSGAHVWSRVFGDGDDQAARALAVDAAGSALVAGQFKGKLSLDGIALASAGLFDVFVAKLAP